MVYFYEWNIKSRYGKIRIGHYYATLISGAFGIFKKDIVINAGGYCEDFVGEDMDIILNAPNNPNHRNMWIIVILIYLTTELTIDLFSEIERSNLDGERLKIMEVLGVILLQVPKIFVYMFVIMPARFYGTITYAWRKNVW